MLLRSVMLAAVIALAILMILKPMQSLSAQKYLFWKIKAGYILYILILVLLYIVYLILVSFIGIIKVEIDPINNTITLIGFSKKRTISISEITNYSTTIKKNGFKKFTGLLLNLKDNKEIQLASQNLKSLNELKQFLIEKHVLYLGETMPRFPFN